MFIPIKRLQIFWYIIGLVLSSSIITTTKALRQNYNAYNYDQTTPQFTPDGRLLQVEYASLAATHSSPCLIWRGIDDGGYTLIMTIRRCSSSRLVPLPFDSPVVVCLSGVLSDSLALLAKVLDAQDEYRKLYGEGVFTVDTAAQTIASACRQHASGGGMRPYGSTLVLVSIENDFVAADASSAAVVGRGKVVQTDPSGGIHTINTDIHIVGGNQEQRQQQLVHDDDDEGKIIKLSEALTRAATYLLEVESKTKESNTNSKRRSQKISLEAMIISKDKGIYRLSDRQTKALLKKIRTKARK